MPKVPYTPSLHSRGSRSLAVSPSGIGASPVQEQGQGMGPWPAQTEAEPQGLGQVLCDASSLQATRR